MTVTSLLCLGFACFALARASRQVLAQGPDDGLEAVWTEALRGGLGWMRPWLFIGPLSWLASTAVHGSGGDLRWVLALGLAPLVGLTATVALAILRASNTAHAHGEGLASGLLAVVAGVLGGLALSVVVRLAPMIAA